MFCHPQAPSPWYKFLSRPSLPCSTNPRWRLIIFVLGVLRGVGGRGTGGSESPAFRTTFSRPPYFCASLPPDSRPSLCCSRLQVNQEDQKPGFNFQTVPKLDILVRFLAFVLAGGSLIPDESYYRSVFLIKLSFTLTGLSQFDRRF